MSLYHPRPERWPQDDSPREHYLREQPIVARWEGLARDGKIDELFADAADVFGLYYSDSDYRREVFHRALGHDARVLASLMLEAGADVNGEPEEGAFIPLYYAITAPDPNADMVKWLLENGADPNTPRGERPLHLATKENNAAAVKLLVQHGADIEAKDIDEHYSPLERAASLGRLELVKLLLDLGAR
jgi:ankyrin repeat protein